MAVFSIGGITSSWLAVVLVFPYIKKLNFNSNATYSLVRYIRPGFFHDFPAFRYLFISLIILLSFYGVFTFKVNDDIRLLSNFDKNLINQQVQVSKILDIPSPFQFFIVTGDSEADALNRADSLSKNLDQLVSDGYISGYQSITQYVPSLDAQTFASKAYDSTNRTLALEKISKEMDMDDQWFRTINQINLPLTLADLRNLPIYKKLSYLLFYQKNHQKNCVPQKN
jgi:predicted exporter